MKALLQRGWNSPTITTWGSLAIRLSSALLVLPMVLVRFSVAEVAVWQLFATLFTLMLLLDFGLSPTFSRLLAYARGGASLDDMASMSRQRGTGGAVDASVAMDIFRTMRWLYPYIAVGIVAVFGALGTLALQRPIAATAAPAAVWWAWALVLGTSAIGMLGNSYGAALQGMDKIAVLRRWEVLTGLLQVACSVAVVAAGGGLLALVSVYQFWLIVGVWRNRQILKRLHPELFTQPAARVPRVLALVWPATWRSGIGTLMSQGIIQGSGVAFSQVGSAREVAAYLLALRFVTMISQFSAAPFYSKLPRLAELHARHADSEKVELATRGMRLAHWIFVIGVLSVALLAQPLLDAIHSQTPFVDPAVWALIAMAFFLERFGAMHLQLYTLTNHVVWHIANGVTGSVMVVLAWLCYPRLGTMAFPVAMLVAYGGFYCIYSARLSYRAMRLEIRSFEWRASIPALATLCATLLFLQFKPV